VSQVEFTETGLAKRMGIRNAGKSLQLYLQVSDIEDRSLSETWQYEDEKGQRQEGDTAKDKKSQRKAPRPAHSATFAATNEPITQAGATKSEPHHVEFM